MKIVTERFGKEIRQYMGSLEFDQYALGDEMVRNHYNKPGGKSCDGIAHTHDCPYVLMEEKSSSKIDEAIEKFEEVEQHLRDDGKRVIKCVLFYNSLRKYSQYYKIKKNILYNKLTGKQIKINKRVLVTMVRRKPGKSKKV